jgi:hypothetical protein
MDSARPKSKVEIQAASAIGGNVPGLKSGVWRLLFGFTVTR